MEETKKKLKVGSIVIVVAILLIAIIGCVVFFTLDTKVGNTIGNIRNYGYAAIQKDWIYYLAPDEIGDKVGIHKIKTDGSEKQELLVEDWDILSLNVVGDRIYFIAIDPSVTEYTDNKIYSIKTDGTELTVLNDREFSKDCYEIYVIGKWIYYIGEDYNIYKMELNGENKTLVSENETGYLGITKDYIIYNEYPENMSEEDEDVEYITYIMDIDGKNKRALVADERLYSVNAVGDYIYYTKIDQSIGRVKVDGTENEILYTDTSAYNMNVSGEYIYYMNYLDLEAENYTIGIFRLKADGTDESPQLIKELASQSSFIDIIGDWVIYIDGNNDFAHINLVQTDGSAELELYRFDYSNVEE